MNRSLRRPIVLGRVRPCSLLLAAVLCCGPAAAQSNPQNWVDVQNRPLTAEFVGLSDSSVQLRMTDGRTVDVPLQRLSPESQSQARSVAQTRLSAIEDQDLRQLDGVREHLGGLLEQPAASSQLLVRFHQMYPASPYAGVWAAAGLSAGENDVAKAKTILMQSIDRIVAQRALSPQRHSTTLASAYNNLAVLHVKSHAANNAAIALTQAIAASSVVAPLINHNAKQLIQLGSDPQSVLSINGRAADELMTALATGTTSGVKTDMPGGWYYALNFNTPAADGSSGGKVDGLEPPRMGLDLVSSGTGLVVAPSMVLTSRTVVETPQRRDGVLVTVGTPAGEPFNSRVVRAVLMTPDEVVDQRYGRSQTQSRSVGMAIGTDGMAVGASVGRSSTAWTTFRIKKPRPGTPGGELAALHVPNLRAKPAVISETASPAGSMVSLFGFRRGESMLRDGLETETGRLISPANGDRLQSSTVAVRGGNRGGPVAIDSGVVIALAIDSDAAGDSTNGQLLPAPAIRRWFYEMVQTTSLEPADSATTSLEPSVVPIFVWAPAADRLSGQLFDDFAESGKINAGMVLKDPYCVQCRGTGRQTCGHPGCKRGQISKSRRVQVAYSEFAGPIYGNKVFKSPCSHCTGRGEVTCTACRQGRID